MAGTNQLVSRVLKSVLRIASREARRSLRSRGRDDDQPAASDGYPGDYHQVPTMTYAPRDDGNPDPGEVVWGWVPYEDDHHQGKDRPVLVTGHHDRWLLALQLTSKDHDRDEAQEAAAGRYWIDIGSGSWDRQGRPSEVRTNRILQLDPSAIRREGGRVSEDTFDRVAAEVRRRAR